MAPEPEEGKAKFYHEVCYCFTKMIVLFFFLYRKLRVIGNGTRVLIFKIQNGNDKYNERIQRQNNNPGSY